MFFYQFWILKRVAGIWLIRSKDGFRHAALRPRYLVRIRFVRVLDRVDTIICSGTLHWLFSPGWDAVKLTLKVGFIFPFVVIGPTDLKATTKLFFQRSYCSRPYACPSSIYPRRRIPAFSSFAHGNKTSLSLNTYYQSTTRNDKSCMISYYNNNNNNKKKNSMFVCNIIYKVYVTSYSIRIWYHVWYWQSILSSYN